MIAIIDYEMGNLYSVAKALEHLGEEVVISGKAEEIEKADKIILPGVGSFREGMKVLHEKGLIRVLEKEVLQKKKPFLGICLGMQLLAEEGEEHGFTKGLGWIPFRVKKFNFKNSQLRIPHMGWDNIDFVEKNLLFKGIGKEAAFYFVHSYHLTPIPTENRNDQHSMIIASCDYGYNFPVAIQNENIFATQFHPEKSQKCGLTILKNFLAWGKAC